MRLQQPETPSVTVTWDHGPGTGPRHGSLRYGPVVTLPQLLEVFRASALAMGFSAELVNEAIDPDTIFSRQSVDPISFATDSEGGHAD